MPRARAAPAATASRYGLTDIAGHVIGCRLTQETRVQNVMYDVASNISQALPRPQRLRQLRRQRGLSEKGHPRP